MIKQFSIKRLGSALIALVMTAGVGMAHEVHKHGKHGKKRAAAHKHMKGMKHNM